MKVKATIKFDDLQDKVKREVGDIFEVSKERADYLFSHNAVEFIEIDDNGEARKIELKEVKNNKSKKRKKK